MAARTLPIVFLVAHFATAFNKEDCVFLTVSSLWRPKEHDRPLIERELELNWSLDPVCENPDRVGLFPQDPRTLEDVKGAALFWAETDQNPDGFLKTNISFGRPSLPGGWDDPMDEKSDTGGGEGVKGDHCYPYWIASFNGATLLHTDCFKVRPSWMADHRDELSRMSLSQLVIPGTHNSACYSHGNKTTPGRDAISRYLLTQDVDVWTQLVHGVRYLDLRIGYYANRNTTSPGDRFWVNHAIVRVTPLVPILRQVARFVTSSPDEVVVVDFHRFPIGMDGHRKRHRQLIAVLRKELGGMAISPPRGAGRYTLGDAWGQSRRLIVCYGERQAAEDSKWLWPPLSQMWGSQQKPAGLREYVDEVLVKPRPRGETHALWALMAELTPTPFDVLFDGSGSLRQMADAVNRNVTQWIRDTWWQQTNIVATDFFLGNNMIDVAVTANLRKAMTDRMDDI